MTTTTRVQNTTSESILHLHLSSCMSLMKRSLLLNEEEKAIIEEAQSDLADRKPYMYAYILMHALDPAINRTSDRATLQTLDHWKQALLRLLQQELPSTVDTHVFLDHVQQVESLTLDLEQTIQQTHDMAEQVANDTRISLYQRANTTNQSMRHAVETAQQKAMENQRENAVILTSLKQRTQELETLSEEVQQVAFEVEKVVTEAKHASHGVAHVAAQVSSLFFG